MLSYKKTCLIRQNGNAKSGEEIRRPRLITERPVWAPSSKPASVEAAPANA